MLPGDRQETAEFQEQAMSKTQMSLDLTLPNISVYLKSKAFFELIYNRYCLCLMLNFIINDKLSYCITLFTSFSYTLNGFLFLEYFCLAYNNK